MLSTITSVIKGGAKGAAGALRDELVDSVDSMLESAGLKDKEKESKKAEIVDALIPLANKVADHQYELNKAALASRSVFVAGGRPFIMWVCAAGLALKYVIDPVAQGWFSMPPLPIPAESIEWLVYALLGLGGMRSIDKYNGSTHR